MYFVLMVVRILFVLEWLIDILFFFYFGMLLDDCCVGGCLEILVVEFVREYCFGEIGDVWGKFFIGVDCLFCGGINFFFYFCYIVCFGKFEI